MHSDFLVGGAATAQYKRGNGCSGAGAASFRQPCPTLPHEELYLPRPSQREKLHVGAGGKTRMMFEHRAHAGGQVSLRGRVEHEVRIPHRDRRRAIAHAFHLEHLFDEGPAATDVDGGRSSHLCPDAPLLDDTTQRTSVCVDEVFLPKGDDVVVEKPTTDAAKTVAAHLGHRTVGVCDVHPHQRFVDARGQQGEDAIATDPSVTVADRDP